MLNMLVMVFLRNDDRLLENRLLVCFAIDMNGGEIDVCDLEC